uniref:Cytochrome oxidase subunit II n=1 Tax=Tolypocladium sp. TaxID=1856741 RepID=A0A6G8IZV5_9HYPO|nr:cytochrome oxidase subunit II [Tolypocladium sp.]
MKNLLNTFIYLDAPTTWGIYFQDSATPQMEGLVELHDNIMYYLVLILFAVGWILFSIIKNFAATKAPISHKYLNHGREVPIQKCSKNNKFSISNYNRVRTYSTSSNNPSINFVKVYENAFDVRKDIYKENLNKSGIYMFTNKLTNGIYIGQSKNLANRFKNYFNISYLKHKDSLVISRALIKYGYSNFSITILEYCEIPYLVTREQYYFDMLSPKYNTLKIAGTSLNYKHIEETKNKISTSLKGIYVKEKSALFGRIVSDKTKELMSIKKLKENNHLFGKTHKESTIELMKQKAIGRIHTEETKLKMSLVRGNPIYIYEKCSSEGFKLIGSFVSAKRAGKFLDISGSTIIRYRNSGEIYKDRYKFSSKLIIKN